MARTRTQQAGGSIRSNIDRMRELTKNVSVLNDKIRAQRTNETTTDRNGSSGSATRRAS